MPGRYCQELITAAGAWEAAALLAQLRRGALGSLSPGCLQSWDLAPCAPGVWAPALCPCPIALCPCLTIASAAAATVTACSLAPAPLPRAASVPAAREEAVGRGGSPQAKGAGGGGLLRGARPEQTESGDRARGAPPTGPPSSHFR